MSLVMPIAKSELRQRMRALRLALGPDDVARRSALAAAHVLALPELAAARCVALYAAMVGSHELDPAPIHDGLRARGIALAYPRVRGRATILAFHAVGERAELVLSALGIPQPTTAAPSVPLDAIDVFVVPGLAFGEQGERIGWGAGHYDRTLAAAPRALRVGYGFDFQVADAVPQGGGDQRMDVVVTDAGVRARSRRDPCP